MDPEQHGRLVVVFLLLGCLSSTETFCTRDRTEYFASRITLATSSYPEMSSLSHCLCVISMETNSTLHIKLHIRSRDESTGRCKPEVQLTYDESSTSVCPAAASNYSLYYEMTKGKRVKVIVINEEERYFKALIVMRGANGEVVRVQCSEAVSNVRLLSEVTAGSSSAFQGAKGGLIAGGVIVFFIVVIAVIMLTTKIGCAKLKTSFFTKDTATTTVSATTNRKATNRSGSNAKCADSAATQCLLNNNKSHNADRSRKIQSSSIYDDMDSRSFKGRDYYAERDYRITITSTSGAVRRWDREFDSAEASLGSRIASRSPSFQYMDRPRIPHRSPSIHSNIETHSGIPADGSTPRLGRNLLVSPSLLPRHPINLYRVDFPIQSNSQQTRHSAPSIAVTSVKSLTPAPPIEVHKAPVFSLNDDDICFNDDQE